MQHVVGDPDASWSVDLPAEEVPAELPEPCLGINFARDGMARKEWLALVAVHSDAWLMSVAFYYGAKLNAEQRYWVQSCTQPKLFQSSSLVNPITVCRRQLFTQLNNSPTLFELVTGKVDHSVGSKRGRSISTVWLRFYCAPFPRYISARSQCIHSLSSSLLSRCVIF